MKPAFDLVGGPAWIGVNVAESPRRLLDPELVIALVIEFSGFPMIYTLS
jgi:hypothetical protein